MDPAEPDVAARGRALFDQLRAERQVTPDLAAPPSGSVDPHSGGVDVDALSGDPGADADSSQAQTGTPTPDHPPPEPWSGRPLEASVAGSETVTVGEEFEGRYSVQAGASGHEDEVVADAVPDEPMAPASSETWEEPPGVEEARQLTPKEPPPAQEAEHEAPSPRGGADAHGGPDPSQASVVAQQGEDGFPAFHVEQPGAQAGGQPAPADAPPEPETIGPAPADAPPALAPSPPDPALTPDVSPVRARHPAADLSLPRIVAIANQKGGVGKTTTAVNLGASLAELGFRTLVVDLDPQGNATTGLGINARNLDNSIYDVLMHEMPIEDCIEPTSVRNLFVAPATIDLAGAEIELVPAFSRELRLKRALSDVADAYEFTIIDCPPSLGLLTINGLAAATEVIVPIQCEYYALEGLSQLMRNVNLVQSNLNPALLLSAIILTMYDARTKLADQVASEVRDHFGNRVCRSVVPRTVRLSEAPSFGQPIIVFDPSSRGALAYRELAKEVSGGTPQRAG